jgi:hypothetical protein
MSVSHARPDVASGLPDWASAPAAITRALADPAAIIVFCLTFAAVAFLPQILNDVDTLWQIRAGEWILDHRAIPAIDPFSFTAADRHWFPHEWLAETVMALAWRAGGMAGVMLLTAAAIALAAAALLRCLRQFLPGIYAVLGLSIALANAAPSMLARPHVLAWPCLVLWCSGLVTARARGTAPSWWLLAAMLAWVNLHGSFMAGLFVAAAFAVEAVLGVSADRRRSVCRAWFSFVAAACGVALLNPDGLGGLLFPFHMLGMRSTAWINEWEPTHFEKVPLLELMILAVLALGLTGKLRLPPIRLLLLLGLIHAALSHARNEQLVGLIGVLILAQPTADALAAGPAAAPGRAWRHLAAATTVLALLAFGARLTVPLDPERTGEAFAATLDHVPAALRKQAVLNEYSLGGRLIFQDVRPFIDSRADLFGDAFLSRYRALISPSQDELDRTLADYGIAWTIFPSDMSIVALMDREEGWRRLYEGDGIVIHARDGSARPPDGDGQDQNSRHN